MSRCRPGTEAPPCLPKSADPRIAGCRRAGRRRLRGCAAHPRRCVRGPAIVALAVLGLALWGGVPPARAQFDDADFAPGFGFVIGEGRTQNDATIRRYGFTSRRMQDDQRSGSLALIYEEHVDGLEFDLLDPILSEEDVELRYQSIFAELKRQCLRTRFEYSQTVFDDALGCLPEDTCRLLVEAQIKGAIATSPIEGMLNRVVPPEAHIEQRRKDQEEVDEITLEAYQRYPHRARRPRTKAAARLTKSITEVYLQFLMTNFPEELEDPNLAEELTDLVVRYLCTDQ